MNSRYNAVIVGQTGVGKSTLINYLYGQQLADAGIGKPVTKNGFHPYDFEINGLPVRLFDSWGLEVGKFDQWLLELKNEFKNRGIEQSADKWFHSVFYCIQAGGARIQDCDIKIIKAFIAENYKISVIFTKCDQVSEDVENELRRELESQIKGISTISVCSEEKATRTGITQKFGKTDIEHQAFSDFFDSLILRLPLHCKGIMNKAVDEWVDKSLKDSKNNMGLVGFNSESVFKEIQVSAEKLHMHMYDLARQRIKQTLEMYGNFATRLGYLDHELMTNDKSSFYHSSFKDGMYPFTWWLALFPSILFIREILMAWKIFTLKDKKIEQAENYIHQCENQLRDIASGQAAQVEKMLVVAKEKVTG